MKIFAYVRCTCTLYTRRLFTSFIHDCTLQCPTVCATSEYIRTLRERLNIKRHKSHLEFFFVGFCSNWWVSWKAPLLPAIYSDPFENCRYYVVEFINKKLFGSFVKTTLSLVFLHSLLLNNTFVYFFLICIFFKYSNDNNTVLMATIKAI